MGDFCLGFGFAFYFFFYFPPQNTCISVISSTNHDTTMTTWQRLQLPEAAYKLLTGNSPWLLTPSEPWPETVLESGSWAKIPPSAFLEQTVVFQCTETFLATVLLTLLLTTGVTSSGFE